MATVKQTLVLQDKMSSVLSKVVTAMISTENTMRRMDGASKAVFDDMTRDIGQAQEAIQDFNNEAGRMPTDLNNAAGAANRLKNPLVTLSALIYTVRSGVEALTGITNMADNFTSTIARLDIMNDGLQTTLELQDMIFESAQRSRAEYGATANAIAKMGLLAGEAFKGTKEIVYFTEILNKAFKVSGASTTEQTNAMYQLSQAMAAGRLQGDEFRSIMENAPMLADAIATYMGRTKGELREMSSQGLITADIIKNALFSAAQGIEDKFQTLPITFGGMMTLVKNQALEAFQPVFERMSQLVNDPQFQIFVNNALLGFNQLANGALATTEFLISAVNWAAENWSWLAPVIFTVVGAMTAYNIVAAISAGIIAFNTFQEALAAASKMTLAGATFTATAAQWGFNAALLANPITWVILVVVALIAALIALGRWIYDLWQTNIDFRVGVIQIWNSILAFFDQVPGFFMMVGYGIADAFSYAKVAVAQIMQSMYNDSIAKVNGIIEGLNKIPGVNIALIEQADFASKVAEEEERARKARQDSLASERAIAAQKDAQRQKDLRAWESAARYKAANGKDGAAAEADAGINWEDLAGKPVAISGGTLDEVGKINSDVSISDEDIKMLKDIAATEFVNRYTTMTPNMQISFGDVRETADVNKILKAIEDMLRDAYDSALT